MAKAQKTQRSKKQRYNKDIHRFLCIDSSDNENTTIRNKSGNEMVVTEVMSEMKESILVTSNKDVRKDRFKEIAKSSKVNSPLFRIKFDLGDEVEIYNESIWEEYIQKTEEYLAQ